MVARDSQSLVKDAPTHFLLRPEGGRRWRMPSAFTQNFYHTVFSTRHRAMLITPELEERLYPFMGGIVRDSPRAHPYPVVP